MINSYIEIKIYNQEGIIITLIIYIIEYLKFDDDDIQKELEKSKKMRLLI
jgi:hypothetical protein